MPRKKSGGRTPPEIRKSEDYEEIIAYLWAESMRLAGKMVKIRGKTAEPVTSCQNMSSDCHKNTNVKMSNKSQKCFR